MNKSISAQENVVEICSILRKKMFGENASAQDYKDSYIVNNAIEMFSEDPIVLLKKSISEEDSKHLKIAKSINFRAGCYEKLCTIGRLLNIPEAEVCRRILYWTVQSEKGIQDNDTLCELKSKITLLKKSMESCTKMIVELEEEIEMIEGRSKNAK